jgi:phosphoglucomutase
MQLMMNTFFCYRFFVTPSDSVAIIAANAVQSIPYFASGLKGVAR